MKKGYASCTFLMGLATIALICASFGTETWSIVHIERGNSTSCVVTRTLGLFNGRDEFKSGCFKTGVFYFSVLTSPNVSASTEYLAAIIAISCLALLFGVIATAVTGYNLCSRPYENWAGPIGLFSYFIAGLIFNLLGVILYIVYGYTDISESIPTACETDIGICEDASACETIVIDICEDQTYKQTGWEFGYSFYIFISSMGAILLGILFVFLSGKQIKESLKKLCSGSNVEEELKGETNIMMF